MNQIKYPLKLFTTYANPEIRDADDAFVTAFNKDETDLARRIVLCMNACFGIKDEQLSGYGVESTEKLYAADLALGRAIEQRDELLEALETAKNGLLWYQNTHPESVDDSDAEAMEKIDAAIAKTEGGAS